MSDWRHKAECRDMDTDLFFPAAPLERRIALNICKQCPVQEQCLRFAETHDRIDGYPLQGVWGGVDFSLGHHKRLLERRRHR